MNEWDKMKLREFLLRPPEKEKKKVEYVKCPCGSGHDIVSGSIINTCPLLYVQVIASASSPNSEKKTEKRTVYYEKPKPTPVDEEMNRAWDHFVESGDFDAVRNLREQRELSNWFMNRWD